MTVQGPVKKQQPDGGWGGVRCGGGTRRAAESVCARPKEAPNSSETHGSLTCTFDIACAHLPIRHHGPASVLCIRSQSCCRGTHTFASLL